MKDSELSIKESYHRIIIPVYIPNKDGYFAESFDVLKLCIKSLLQTIHDKTLITIINNNSYSDVTAYLRNLLEEKRIDQLIEYQENKGKVDPVVSAMKGSLEPLITVTDCDVFFKFGWQNAIETVFSTFRNVGIVSPLPNPSLKNYYTSFSWFYGILHYKIKKISINDFDYESLVEFKKSISNDLILSKYEKSPYVITKDNINCIIGAGHFCATFSNKILKYIPNKKSGLKFNGAEKYFLDKPCENAGLMRLSTCKGHIYHIGNKVEKWMLTTNQENKNILNESKVLNIKTFRLPFLFNVIIVFLFSRKKILRFFFNI